MKGFTLLETLIYAVVLGIFLSLALLAAHGIFSSQADVRVQGEIVASAELIERKITWIMGQARMVESPVSGSSSNSLTIRTSSSSTDPAVFSVSGDALALSLAGVPPIPLHGDRVLLTSFTVTHTSTIQSSSSLDVALSLRGAAKEAVSSSVRMTFTAH